jgi:hypothetical protein
VPPCFRIFVTFGEPEINDVDHVLVLPCTNQEVVWLDISMKEPILMDKLNSLQL